MGFMKGFGSSFSTSFENARTRRAAKERDAFQVAYDSFQRNSTQYEEDKKADEALINSAKTLVSQAGLPEETWEAAYKRLRAGFTVEKTDEWLRSNKFSVTPATEAPSEAQAPSTVDGEMEQLGQVDPASVGTNPTMGQPTDVSGGLLSDQAETATAPQTQAPVAPEGFDQANQEVAQAAGVTQEQMEQYNTGYQSPELSSNITIEQKIQDPLIEFGLEDGITKAKLASAKVRADQYRNSDDPSLRASAERFDAILPSIEASLATDPELDTPSRIELIKASADIRQPIREQSSAVKDMATMGVALDDFVKKHPEVITMTGAGAGAVVGIANEANALMNLIGDMGKGGADENAVQAAIKQWEADLLDDGTLAESASIFAQHAALQVRFIYASGKAMGQSGNGFSNYDFDNIKKSIQASNGYEAYSQNLRSLISERANSVQNLIDDAMGTMEIQSLMDDESAKSMLLVELQDMNDRLDPTIVEWINGSPVDPTLEPDYNLTSQPEASRPGALPPNAIPVTKELIEQLGGDLPPEAEGRHIIVNGNTWEYVEDRPMNKGQF